MSLPCKILASCLLICNFPTEGADPEKTDIIWGGLHQAVFLHITDFQMYASIDDIRWFLGQHKIAQFKRGKKSTHLNETYELLQNGTLKIRNLSRYSNNIYKVEVYDKDGKHMLDRKMELRVQELVSKPEISTNCSLGTVTCEVTEGSDPELKLFQNENLLKEGRQINSISWDAKQLLSFNCTASNKVSSTYVTVTINCAEKGLSVYLILSIVGGGIALFIFVALLLLFYISKKRKRGSMRNDEEPEIRTHKITPEERVRKPNQTPGFICQTPAVSQPPPPPGHRCRPVGHRVQQQQQKRPIPTPSGTQVQQQKGPPLPRPRVQQKLLPSAVENS